MIFKITVLSRFCVPQGINLFCCCWIFENGKTNIISAMTAHCVCNFATYTCRILSDHKKTDLCLVFRVQVQSNPVYGCRTTVALICKTSGEIILPYIHT